MSTAAVQFHELSRRFGPLRVFSGLSGSAESGEVLFVAGANGSGKSTLLRCLAGLLRPDRGTIAARDGGGELDLAARRARVGFVSPDLAFYDELSGAENLDFFARLRGIPAAAGRSLAERLGLPLERPFQAMSSGMRQRLRWAFALHHQPEILLLDEPFQNLDAEGEAVARALLSERLAAGALAVIASPSPIALPGVVRELRLGR